MSTTKKTRRQKTPARASATIATVDRVAELIESGFNTEAAARALHQIANQASVVVADLRALTAAVERQSEILKMILAANGRVMQVLAQEHHVEFMGSQAKSVDTLGLARRVERALREDAVREALTTNENTHGEHPPHEQTGDTHGAADV